MGKIWIGVHFANKIDGRPIQLWMGFHGATFIKALRKAYRYAKQNKWGTIKLTR